MKDVSPSKVCTLYVPPKGIVKLIEKVNMIFVLSLSIGIGYGLYFVLPENSMTTYISEKGLMPGLVNEKFNNKIYGFSNRDGIFKKLKHNASNKNRSLMIKEIIEDMGYRGHLQDYNYLKYDRNISNTNVYTIVKCVRGPCTESIVLVVPLSMKYIESQIMTLELLNYFNSLTNWSKNVIFFFTPDLIGTQAFLSAYYNQDHPNIQYQPLEFSSGDLIGGVVLNLSGRRFSRVNVQYNMINGRYPNLDWFNGIVRILEKFDLKTSIHTPKIEKTIKDLDPLMYHGKHCLRSILSQAFLETENFHSLFGLHCISMVTLQSDFNNGNGHVTIISMTEVVEATIRALNNLDERFHHSYQFYLLTSCHNFLSIAYYEPMIGFLCLPLLLKALANYYSISLNFKFPLSFLLTYLYSLFLYFISTYFYFIELTSFVLLFSTFLPLLFIPFIHPSTTHRFVVNLLIPLSLGAISLLNFSFALIFALIYSPVAFIVIGSGGDLYDDNNNNKILLRFFKFIKKLLLITLHPYILYICCQVYSNDFDINNHSYDNFITPLKTLIHNHVYHYSFNFPLFLVSIIPIWHCIIFSI
uniref:Glycosylphosphatidylinositol anchor attachment 1 protein (inferred by orthology to a human protein) n=1 Tax=Strongyloides venezuelensis TaxID=75913 RepID=A0A0K0EZA0_STRVS